MSNNLPLIWLDLEMTGLDPEKDVILEIATIVTDGELNIVAEGPNLVIHQSDHILKNMNAWCIEHHTRTGLVEKSQKSSYSEQKAEDETLAFLKKYVNANQSPMCGNTIHQDRRFLYSHMKKLHDFFHYRNVDVSTVKELARRWSPDLLKNMKKEEKHEALSDVRESILEMKYYKKSFFLIH